MYIEVTYDISLDGDRIEGLASYLEANNIEDSNFEILVWGNAKFFSGEYDSLQELNITDIELLKDDNKIDLTEEQKKELIEAVENAIDDTRFYYSNYDDGELYFKEDIDEDNEEESKLAKFLANFS